MIRFQCENCSKSYKVDDRHAGKKTKCAKCGSPLAIPPLPVVVASPPPVAVQQPVAPLQSPAPQVRVAFDQPQKTGTGGFFRAFGITSGFMAAIAIVVVGLPILACGGCLGLAFLIAPSEEEMARIRAEQAKIEEEAAELGEIAPVSEPATSGPTMTAKTYSEIREGMTYDEVIAIVGKPSKEISSNQIGGIRTVMYQWDAGFMANANGTFQNGKLVAKAQFGL